MRGQRGSKPLRYWLSDQSPNRAHAAEANWRAFDHMSQTFNRDVDFHLQELGVEINE